MHFSRKHEEIFIHLFNPFLVVCLKVACNLPADAQSEHSYCNGVQSNPVLTPLKELKLPASLLNKLNCTYNISKKKTTS